MIQSFLNTISKIINSYLQLDSESEKRLQKLQGKIISIELLPLHLNFHCEFQESGVRITDKKPPQVSAKISGTPWQLLHVMVNKKNRQQFFAQDLKIEGNIETANQVVKLFDDLHVDLENELSRFIGDTTAFHVSNFVKNTRQWLRTTVDSFAADVNEYTHEEAKWFPPSEALNDFFNDIDELRMSVDRFEKKLNQFNEKLKSKNKKQDTNNDEGAQ